MALAFRSATEAGTGSAASSLAINVPTGVQDGDHLVLFGVTADGDDGGFNTLTGWDEEVDAATFNTGGSAPSPPGMSVWRRIASSEPASYTITPTAGSTGICAKMIACSGGDDTTQWDVAETTATGDGTNADPPSITPTTDGALTIVAAFWDSTTTVWTGAPSGYTDSDSLGSVTGNGGGNGCTCAIAHRNSVIDPAAAENPAAFSSSSEQWGAVTVALRPAAAGITSVTPDEFDMDAPNVDVASSGGAFDASGNDVYLSDADTLAGSANEVDISASIEEESTTGIKLALRDRIDNYALSDGNINMDVERGVAQSFPGSDGVLSYARFELSKLGSPTGDVYANLYAHSGTYGTSSVPTGSPLATSKAIDASELTATPTDIYFDFKADPYTLASGTNYVIALMHATGDGSNNVRPRRDDTTVSHGGNYSEYNGTSWSADNTRDIPFGVYTEARSFINSLHTLGPGARYIIVDATGGEYSWPVTLHRPIAFVMSLGAGTPGSTAQRLTGLTGTFAGGRFEEAVNPSATTTNVADDGNREDVWSIEATTESRDETYVGRVLYGGQVPDTITQTPTITVTSATTGAGDQSVPATTQSASGGEEIAATVAQTVPAASQSATAELVVTTGVGTQIRPLVTQSATAAETMAGTAAQSRATPTQTASGAEAIAAAAAQDRATPSQSATAAETIAGSADQQAPLPSQSTTGIGAPGTTSTGAQTRTTPSQDATGAAPYVGSGDQSRATPTQSGTGDAGGPNTGIGDQSRAAASQSATGIETAAGAGNQARTVPTQSAAGLEAIAGTADQSAPTPSQTTSGIGAPGTFGSATQARTQPSQSATGLMHPDATAAQTLALTTQTATGLQTITVTGSATQIRTLPVQAGDGALQPEGQAAQIVAARSQDAMATPVYAGTGAQSRPATTQTGAGLLAMTAVADQLLPGLSQAGTAIMLPAGIGAQLYPAPTQQGAARQAEGPGDVVASTVGGPGAIGTTTGPGVTTSTTGTGSGVTMTGGNG